MFNLYQCGYGPIQSWVHQWTRRFGRRSWAQSLAHRKATLQRFQVGSVAAAHKHWHLQDNSPGHRDSRWRTANRPHLHLAQPKPRCPLQSTHSGRRRGRPEAKHVVHVLRQGRVPSASLKSERIHQHLSKIKAKHLSAVAVSKVKQSGEIEIVESHQNSSCVSVLHPSNFSSQWPFSSTRPPPGHLALVSECGGPPIRLRSNSLAAPCHASGEPGQPVTWRKRQRSADRTWNSSNSNSKKRSNPITTPSCSSLAPHLSR